METKIRRLDPSVVSKIAAGEIIVSPVNALKEMLENSIDAKATMIDILVKEGGVKLLQVTDDGVGINKEDLPILCERFTTSKLSKFEDLESIATYGFRGEALASISHVAKVTVTTKTEADQCAWKVSYMEGKMLGKPVPTAGKDGTTILVEDLFYNLPSRLRSLRSPNEILHGILDVVGRYAIHSKGIGFSCKKFGDAQYSLAIKPNFGMVDRIRSILGNEVASHLLDFTVDVNEDLPVLGISGKASDLNFVCKKAIQPIFFINNRLVSCDPLRRSLNQVYSNFLAKGNRPFVYLSILVDPASVDVNIHPTKKEVRFLHQDEIFQLISTELHEMLSKIDTSRMFKTSTLITDGSPIGNSLSQSSSLQSSQRAPSLLSNGNNRAVPVPITKSQRVYDNRLIRTDASQSKITSFLRSSQYIETMPTQSQKLSKNKTQKIQDTLGDDTRVADSGTTSYDPKTQEQMTSSSCDTLADKSESSHEISGNKRRHDADTGFTPGETSTSDGDTTKVGFSNVQPQISHLDDSQGDENNVVNKKMCYKVLDKERKMVSLTSIKSLRQNVDNAAHAELTNIFANLTYVGLVDEERRLVAIQHDLKLFLVDYGSICNELFYQIGLTDFSNYGKIYLRAQDEEELNILNLLSVFDDLTIQQRYDIVKTMWDMQEMLDEYFSIELKLMGTSDTGNPLDCIVVRSIPLLLKGYNPPLSKLPHFFRRMGTKVNWEEEEPCLNGILRQIALLYVPEVIVKVDVNDTTTPEDVKVEYVNKCEDMSSVLEHVIFPCIKRRFLATRDILRDIVEIANLPGLYKVFERC